MANQRILQFDWELVEGRVISAVLGTDERDCYDSDPRWLALALILKDISIIFIVDVDTDEIAARLEEYSLGRETNWTEISALSGIVGHKLGWFWTCINSQGYFDTAMFSIDGIDPTLILIAEASALRCKNLIRLGQGH